MPKLTAGRTFYKRRLWVDILGVHHYGEDMEYTVACDFTYSSPTKSTVYHQAACL